MTTLEIILIGIIWISYGTFNAWQHEWYRLSNYANLAVFMNILLAPVALSIRIFRGVFRWRGIYKN